MKKCLSIFGLVFIFSVIGGLFWFNEWKYSLPTPVPAHYHAPAIGEHISLGKYEKLANEKPLFVHFFNPDCPCSRFNIKHFKALAAAYAGKINFAVVVVTKDKSYTEAGIKDRFGFAVPVLFDTSLAAVCGVYSTPQAVLMDRNQTLYYRGNYNRSRYCTDPTSNYAQQAIDSLLAQHPQPIFDHYALTAYGCTLPVCTK